MTRMNTAFRLAIQGGAPAVTRPLPAMAPGALRLGREEERGVLAALRSKKLSRHAADPSNALKLERLFARRVGAAHAVAVNSGTSALVCALAGIGAGPGDEVVVPAFAWITTATAVMAVGAVPVLAEIDESLTLDVGDVRRKISARTKAIIAVHMRGAPCRMSALMELAGKKGIKVLEDVAQANGGSHGNRKLGSVGHAGVFSFQLNKIITSGEGGLAATSDAPTYRRMLSYHDAAAPLSADAFSRNSNAQWLPGLNLRMSELEAAIALAQLGRLDGILSAMRRRKAELKARIAGLIKAKGAAFRVLHDEAGDTAIALIFFAPEPAAARLIAGALRAEGVPASVLYEPARRDLHVYEYWVPVLRRRAAAGRGERAREICPRTLDLLGRAVHLDISPELTSAMTGQIAFGVTKVLRALL